MATSNEQIIDSLIQWGCDIPGAMERFLNDKGFYCTNLHSVPEETAFADLGSAIDKKDTTAAFAKAHELKGVLANLGLTPMYQTCCQIVEPLRAGKMTDVPENYQKLMSELDELKTFLK